MSARHLLATLAILLGSVPTALGAVPDLDPAFNGGQARIVDYGSHPTRLGQLLVDGSARVVVAGSGGGTPVLGRLLPGGATDGAFGSGGVVRPGSTCGPVGPAGLLLDPNGRLGTGFGLPSGCAAADTFQVVRYTDNGAEDTSYADQGRATVEPGLTGETASARELRVTLGGPLGRTWLVSTTRASVNAAPRLRVLRLDPDGALDPGYGTGGRATADIPTAGSSNFGISDALLYADGRLLVVGTTQDAQGREAMYALRLTAAGAPDTSFSGDGSVIVQAGPAAPTGYSETLAVALAPTGAVYLAGMAHTRVTGDLPEAVLVRLTAAGVPDTGFPVVRAGGATFGAADHSAIGVSVVAQGDGKPLLTAQLPSTGGGMSLGLARYTTAGQPDTTFGTGGYFFTSFGGPTRPWRSALSGTGRLVVTGDLDYSTESQEGIQSGFVARFTIREGDRMPPESSAPPGLTGTPRPGQTLTCTAGTWRNSPTTITVAWDRAPRATSSPSDPAWQPIAGSTGRTYVVQNADLGSRVRCREVATNGDGSATAPSPSKRVDAGVPALLRAPAVTGTPIVGQRLQCDVGEWSNGPDLAITWERGATAIAGADQRSYVTVAADRRARVGCEVTATNDNGPAAKPQPSNTLLVVGAPPTSTRAPHAEPGSTGPNPTDAIVTCTDPGAWDEDYGTYEYRWRREGAEIAGATGKVYEATVDDLGTDVSCVVYSTNPAGRSEGAESNPVLVPLPTQNTEPTPTASPGAPPPQTAQIYTAGGFNLYDPINMYAVSGTYLSAIGDIAVAHRRPAIEAMRNQCRGEERPAELPETPPIFEHPSYLLKHKATCAVLLLAPASDVVAEARATRWLHGCTRDNLLACPRLDIPVDVDPRHPEQLSLIEQTKLATTLPKRVLWDIDGDHRTDASCDPEAPVLRSLYSEGAYHVSAVIIGADSAITGRFAVVDHDLLVHSGGLAKGTLRPAQPFACKTSVDPPPEPDLPCTKELWVGRAHLEGNLCPVSLRRIPEPERRALPDEVRAVLDKQAFEAKLRRASLRAAATPAPAGSVAAVTTAQVGALAVLAETKTPKIPDSWREDLSKQKGFTLPAAQSALDQIYIASDAAKLNGVDVKPGKLADLVMVPSDAGQAIDGVRKMTLSSTDAATTLGGVPIGDAGALRADLLDKVGVAPPALREVNLDALADSLKSKLNLGPFKLAGDTRLRLADDGSAFLDAHAELPGLLGGPGSSPIRTDITVHADPAGRLQLQGIHLEVGKAYLAAVKIKDLRLDYDGRGLSVQGQLLFPPVDAGIAINKFRLNDKGVFQELDVDYLAGAGQGIPLGPGIFMTRLGGGFSLDPDEIRGRATFSIGPSTGGGCPTAGIDAGFVVHFAPVPFYVKATGEVKLLCIPLASASFYADSTGLVDLAADVHVDAGPIYFGAKLHGAVKLPRWQVDLRGEGGIRHIISAEVKALVGSLGLAACGRVEIFPETPISDPVTIAAGGGMRFVNGRPPLSFSEIVNNIEIFFHCDLSSWSPFGRDVRSAGDGTARTFTQADDDIIALELVGAGGPPRVRLRAPDGKVIDATGLGEDLTTSATVSGLIDRSRSRTVLFVHGEKGDWTVEPDAGSPAIVDMRRADVLPQPHVTATVGGAGAARVLRYDVTRVPGQQVRFVEHGRLGQRVIETVDGGGRGRVPFTTSESQGTARTVVAEVVQDGMPRANLTVAKFNAPSPSPTRPRRVRIRRNGRITWAKAAYAARYEVVVTTASGNRVLLDAKTPSVRPKGAVRASVVAISPAGRRSAAGVSSRSGRSGCRTRGGRGRAGRCRRRRTAA